MLVNFLPQGKLGYVRSKCPSVVVFQGKFSMKIKNLFQNISIFDSTYSEKGAIKGHSVDRYAYACQLIHKNTNESLINAYAWLSVAAQETDRERLAKQLMNTLGFELKKRGLFEEGLKKCQEYYDLYSPEALIVQINSHKSPLNYCLRFLFKIATFLENQVDFFDAQIIKNRGSSFFWMRVALSSSCVGMIAMAFWLKYHGYGSSIFLTLSILSSAFSTCLYEKRSESADKD